MKVKKLKQTLVLVSLILSISTNAQIIERKRPKEWDNLVLGGRFMDRFLPISPIEKLTTDTWGAKNVIPRYIANGIEDKDWSYWGGNALLGKDGKYHLFVCRWREDAKKGHHEWPNSIVVQATSKNPEGPYKVIKTIGPGHNPEAFQLIDGRYVIYVINGRYVSDSINGPWKYSKFNFDNRDRPIIEGLSNLSFAQREDGSYIMVCRGGGIWFSKDGLSTYNQVTDRRVYPPVEGRFEDPVIWRTNIQYHLIVNDWYGRIAYYLRSKDGIHWKTDTGEAYLTGITKYTDGTNEDWFKYERIKVMQDELGRATQAHFAVIDVLKNNDKARDNHSSKNITIPLVVGRQIEILEKKKINEKTKKIKLKIKAEKGFDPHTDINLNSLSFGAPEKVNYGNGCKIIKVKKAGKDLIVTFNGKDNGISADNFVAKLLGKTKEGKLLFGYARLPWISYKEPVLSARFPIYERTKNSNNLVVEVENFGQTASSPTTLKIEIFSKNKFKELATATVPNLDPFQKKIVKLNPKTILKDGENLKIRVTFGTDKEHSTILKGNLKYRKTL